MSENNQGLENTPFFERYLEGQESEKVSEELSEKLSEEESNSMSGGSKIAVTLKYPSDHEDTLTRKITKR